jgi:purine nucleosidase
MRRFLIDTDTGSDDAVALIMALRRPDVQVEAITVVAGNVPLEMGVQNALYTLEQVGANVPVYAGQASPLLRPLVTAQDVHGWDGMGDIGLPLTGRQPAPGHAVDAILQTVRRYPGEITLVTLGPLTNIALALRHDPSLAQQVKRCVVMGGVGEGHGNMTPVAEYNIWADPDAARIVFESGIPIEMVGWDISRRYAVFAREDVEAVLALNTPLAHFSITIQRLVWEYAFKTTQLAGFDLPDPIAMAVALDPSIARFQPRYVAIETNSGLCQGQTVVDHIGITGHEPNVALVTEASRAGFIQLLHTALR